MNAGEERYKREFQIYENKSSIRLALEHLREEAIELEYIKDTNDDFSIREDVICALFGNQSTRCSQSRPIQTIKLSKLFRS